MINDTEDGMEVEVETAESQAEEARIISWMRKNQAMQKKHGEALKAIIHDWEYDRAEVLSFVAIYFDENPRD